MFVSILVAVLYDRQRKRFLIIFSQLFSILNKTLPNLLHSSVKHTERPSFVTTVALASMKIIKENLYNNWEWFCLILHNCRNSMIEMK